MDKPDYKTYRQMLDGDDDEPEVAQEYFTAEEIAAYMQIPVEEFHNMAGHGNLLPVHIDEQYVYRQSDVEQFLIDTGVIEGEETW